MGWLEIAQALTAPFGVFAALLWAFIVLVKIQPQLRRVQADNEASLRASTADGAERHIQRLEKHIADLMRWRKEDAAKIRALEERTEECEAERAELKARIVQLEAYHQARGDARQHAALIVAAEKAGAK